MRSEIDEEADRFVSTGSLPREERVSALVSEAHERYRSEPGGSNSQVYPALARVPSNLFGVCVVNVHGAIVAAGDAEVEFAIMSVAKPFSPSRSCSRSSARSSGPRIRERCWASTQPGFPSTR
jgi:glutaminase